MFITDEDYRVVIGDDALKVLSRASGETRYNSELEAIEEISGYLRPKYDCFSIFGAEDDFRNRLIVMRTVDIALYHLSASQPMKMGHEVRKERYDRAIEWLEDVRSGKITLDLPLADEDDTASSNGTIFHSEPRLRHNW